MPKIPFVGPTYQAISPNIDAQSSINLYPEVRESPAGKSIGAMVGSPGLTRRLTLPRAGGVRGLRESARFTRLFAVQGSGFFEIMADWTFVERGQLITSSGPVSMAENDLELEIVDGPFGYNFNYATNVFQQITDPEFRGGNTVVFQDGYFVFNEPSTGRFYLSQLRNGLSFIGTDFTTAESAPDNIIGMVADHQELWAFGSRTSEPYYNSGNPDFPFSRIDGGLIENGTASAHSLQKMDNSVFLVGADDRGQGIVWRVQGYQPSRVSTHAIETALRGYGDLSPVTSFTYQDSGHTFYVLNHPQATWVFDAATNLWHQRAWLNKQTNTLERDRPEWHAHVFNQHIVGDYANGDIYTMDNDVYDSAGNEIHRERVAASIAHPELDWAFHDRVRIDLEAGVGLSGSPGPDEINPKIYLDWSNDGGHTWSNKQEASMGRIGEYRTRALWRRLGRARERYYRITTSAKVKIVLVDGYLETRR